MEAKEKEFLQGLLAKIENTNEPQEIMIVFLQLSNYLENRPKESIEFYKKYLFQTDSSGTEYETIKFRTLCTLKAMLTFTLW